MEISFLGKDKNDQDEQTVYWFSLTGVDNGTGWEFEGQTFGISESGTKSCAVDADSYPLIDSDSLSIAVRRHCVVTDAMPNGE